MKSKFLPLVMSLLLSHVALAGGRGTIVIIKDAQPNSDQDFQFRMAHPAPAEFKLDDDLDPTLSNTQTFEVDSDGSYVVSEDRTPGWQLTSITCTETGSQNTITSLPARHAVIMVEDKETIACIFVNTRLGPTAANVVISGRIQDPSGRGVPRTSIVVTDFSNNKSFMGRSNNFGYYSVQGIEAGSFVEVRASAKGKSFQPVYLNVMQDEVLNFVSEGK